MLGGRRMIQIWICIAGAAFLVALMIVLYSALAVVSEPLEEPEPTPEPVSWVKYPVPLDDGLQMYIIRKCKERGISPALVMAVIGAESQFRADAIGDHGNSFGLMQIYKSVHEERMKKLGVSDLLNPYENVTVGIDFLADLLDKGNGPEWALSYYCGMGGAECEYAYKVLRLAECLAEGVMVKHG